MSRGEDHLCSPVRLISQSVMTFSLLVFTLIVFTDNKMTSPPDPILPESLRISHPLKCQPFLRERMRESARQECVNVMPGVCERDARSV